MEQINRIELRGVVGSVRVRSVNGRQVATVNMVTNFVYKSKDGDPVLETTWHQVSLWEGKGIEDLTRIVKGSKIHVVGRLRAQQYTDAEGVSRFSYEVVAGKASLIEGSDFLQYEI